MYYCPVPIVEVWLSFLHLKLAGSASTIYTVLMYYIHAWEDCSRAQACNFYSGICPTQNKPRDRMRAQTFK